MGSEEPCFVPMVEALHLWALAAELEGTVFKWSLQDSRAH